MKTLISVVIALGSLQLAACGGQGDDTLGDEVENRAEERSGALEVRADDLEMQAEQLDERASAIEEAASARSDAIDAADIDADGMTDAQRQAIIDDTEPAVR